jgi:hypothetical protein
MYKQLFKKDYCIALHCIATKEEDFFSKVKALKVAKEVSK